MSRSSSYLSFPLNRWLRGACLVGVLGLCAWPAAGEAQEPTADEYAEQGYKKYEKGEFAEAIAYYMRAFKVSQDARILFNIAQIYDRKIQDRELAIEFYRRYLKSTTTEPDLIKKATERVRTLQEQAAAPPVASAPAATAPPPPSAPPPPPPASPPLWIGWTAAGAFAAGAVITGLVASSKASDARNIAYSSGASGPADDRMSSAKTMALVSTLFTAGAVIAGGITVYLTVAPGSPTTALTVGPGSFSLGRTF